MSGALLARFIFVIFGTILIAVLRWPYPTWLKVAAIAILVTQGAVAAGSLRSSATEADIRNVSRWLLALDLAVTALLVHLYFPLYPMVWAFLLLLIVFGSTQDRQAAALASGAVSVIVVVASYLWPASPPVVPFRSVDLLVVLCIIAMTTAGVNVLYQAIASRSATLAAESQQLQRLADSQSTLRAASEAQAERMQKVIELAITLMRERELGPLLDRILEATTQTFGFRCGAIMTAERDREVFAYRSVQGYPADQMRRLMVREVPFAQANLKLDSRFLVRPSAYYAPVERQSWHTDPLTCYRPEAALLPRENRGAWHEADTLLFTLTSSSGEIIGLLCPDSPLDGNVPSSETMDNVAMFAQLAAAAIENVYLGSVEPRREVAERVARILDLTAAIFVERDLDTLLHRILSTVLDSFNFNAGTILLREAGRDAYVRRAALGFPREVEGKEVSGAGLREMMNDRTRVRDTFYYAPMELNVAGGVTRDPNRAILPRVESGQWHENDILLFPIFNSHNELIGVLTPDDPKDRRVPAYETIQALEVFARIAGLAIETALIRSMVGKI
jgi:transcriptional regulator with GAF, ATPase, and Fis domain